MNLLAFPYQISTFEEMDYADIYNNRSEERRVGKEC